MEVLQHSNIVDKFEIDRQRRMTMQHCKREYCNAGTRQWSQRGIYIRKASKAKNSEQIIIRSNDSRYRGYPKTEKNAIQQRGVVTIQEAVTGFLAEKENTIKLSSYLRYEHLLIAQVR